MTVTHPLDHRSGAPDAWVIHLPAELDLRTAGDLAPMVEGAVLGTTGTIVFDCSSLTFIDASGIGALVAAANAAGDAGREVRLLHPSTTLCRLLLLTGVGRRFVVDAA